MQLTIESNIAMPTATKLGNPNPEYTALATQLDAMAVGQSFEVTVEDATKVRYVASNVTDVPLASRTDKKAGTTRFWRIETRPVREKRAPKAVAPAATESAPVADTAAEAPAAE